MAANDALIRADFIPMAVPIAANAGVGPITGDPLMFGAAPGMAGVAENSYTPPTGIPTGFVGVSFVGASFFPVAATDGASPPVGVAVKVGDKLYASGGTLDATTNCYYGFQLNTGSGGRYYGNALDAIPSGQTATIRVRRKVTG